jgi:DNA-binding MarR family transcriptional regulator
VLNAVRTSELLLRAIGEIWRRHGLSLGAGNVLVILAGAGGALPPHVISERRLVTRGAITGLLDYLEKRGMVRRRPHPGDRRMVLVEVTRQGAELVEVVQPQIVDLEVKLLRGLSTEEQEVFILLNGKLQDYIARSQ